MDTNRFPPIPSAACAPLCLTARRTRSNPHKRRRSRDEAQPSRDIDQRRPPPIIDAPTPQRILVPLPDLDPATNLRIPRHAPRPKPKVANGKGASDPIEGFGLRIDACARRANAVEDGEGAGERVGEDDDPFHGAGEGRPPLDHDVGARVAFTGEEGGRKEGEEGGLLVDGEH